MPASYKIGFYCWKHSVLASLRVRSQKISTAKEKNTDESAASAHFSVSVVVVVVGGGVERSKLRNILKLPKKWCRGLAHREGSRHPWQPCSKKSNTHHIWRKHWKYSNSYPRRVTSGCTECNNSPTNQPSCRNFDQQPPLSLMNEKQLTAYSIDLINHFWTTKEKW